MLNIPFFVYICFLTEIEKHEKEIEEKKKENLKKAQFEDFLK